MKSWPSANTFGATRNHVNVGVGETAIFAHNYNRPLT